jgi:hypothetical protein
VDRHLGVLEQLVAETASELRVRASWRYQTVASSGESGEDVPYVEREDGRPP